MNAAAAGTPAGLAGEYPGWVVWATKPIATRVATGRAPRGDGVWVATRVCDDWAELEQKLADQVANDAAHA